MKKALLPLCGVLLFGGIAQADNGAGLITLDLTKATTPLTFDPDNGSWTGTFDENLTSIDSQVFSFVHSAMGEWQTWWGFTASNSADNTRPQNTMTQQWSNMAKGGIVLNADGSIKLDEYGAPVVSKDVPYMVAYYNFFMAERAIDMTFTDGKTYEPQGVYVNLTSYPYYCIEYGDAFARAFNNGDDFTLTFHGVAPSSRADGETEKTLTVSLASYANGDLTINRGWKYVDLTPLGAVNEIYFTMQSTDSGSWGMNTPGYFCMDKLTVKPADGSAITSVSANRPEISYDRTNKSLKVSGAEFTMIRNSAGRTVMSGDSGEFDLSDLPAGVYIVSAGNHTLKIAR